MNGFEFRDSASCLEEALLCSMDSTYRNTCESNAVEGQVITLHYGRLGFLGTLYAWHDFEVVACGGNGKLGERGIGQYLQLPRFRQADVAKQRVVGRKYDGVPFALPLRSDGVTPPREIEPFSCPVGVVGQRGLCRYMSIRSTSASMNHSLEMLGPRDLYRQNYLLDGVIMLPPPSHLPRSFPVALGDVAGKDSLMEVVLRNSCVSVNVADYVAPWRLDEQCGNMQAALEANSLGSASLGNSTATHPMLDEYNDVALLDGLAVKRKRTSAERTTTIAVTSYSSAEVVSLPVQYFSDEAAQIVEVTTTASSNNDLNAATPSYVKIVEILEEEDDEEMESNSQKKNKETGENKNYNEVVDDVVISEEVVFIKSRVQIIFIYFNFTLIYFNVKRIILFLPCSMHSFELIKTMLIS